MDRVGRSRHSLHLGDSISNSHSSTASSRLPLEAVQATDTYQKLDQSVHRALRKTSVRRRLVRIGLVSFNMLLLGGVLFFVVASQRSTTASSVPVSALGSSASGSTYTNSASQSGSVANPLDQVSSADIALNVATMSSLPEATAVANQAASVNLELSAAPATASIVSKPQVVSTALKSRKDIKTYVAATGDTVASIATKFGVTSDSIKWSNSLTSNNVLVGQSLSIPPAGVSGIVYTVKAGDTPDSLAAKYKANKDEIIAYNDAELTALKPGEKIIIPGGSIAAPVVVAARTVPTSTGSFAFGSSAMYGSNGYDFGYCTWYVANMISVPSNWGNANTWDNGAIASGWTVSSIPRVGAIGQTDRGAEGHVAVVEAVSDDGTMIKYSDMNGLAGWGRVGRTSDFVGASKFEHYIYR